MGGLSRRATIVDTLRGKGTIFVVDAGDLYWRSNKISDVERPQQAVKAELQAHAYALAGVDAMVPSDGDFAMGRDFVEDMAKQHDLPYVTTDLVCDGKTMFPPVRTIERDGITMAVIGLVGPEVSVPGCERTDGLTAVRGALDGVKADVVVLLSGEDAKTSAQIAKDVGHIDFLVVADRKQDDVAEVTESGALRLGTGSRGKKLGALAFTLTPGATGWRDDGALANLAEKRDGYKKRVDEYHQKLTDLDQPALSPGDQIDKTTTRTRLQNQVTFYEKQLADAEAKLKAASDLNGNANIATNTLYDLDAAVADQPATQALVDKAKDAVAAAAPPAPERPAQYAYIGSGACASCHAAETAQWKTTAHAHAWQTLVGVKRQLDNECFECHTTGAKTPSGPENALAASGAGLMNVGCESCHGPGREHASTPTITRMRRDPGVDVCMTCHDGKQDGGRFDYPTYRPQILHTAMGAAKAAPGSAPPPSPASPSPASPSPASPSPGPPGSRAGGTHAPAVAPPRPAKAP